MFTIGLDVHQSRSSICVLDALGNKIRQEQIHGGWDKLLASLAQIKMPFQICYEASVGYGALHQRLAPLAQKVVVANPNKVRLIFQSTRKSDRADACHLATLLHLNQVPRVHVPPQDIRSWRGLIEHRRKLVDQRVGVKNQIRALLRTFGISAPRSLWTKAGIVWLKALDWPTELEAVRLQLLLDLMDALSLQIRRALETLDRIADRHPAVALLKTVPGVGPRTAEAFVAYVDDPRRFRNGTIGAYFGLVPREDSSGNVRRLGHITHEGPGTVRKLLAEAAWRGIKDSPTLCAVYDRLLKGDDGRKKIAVVGLCHWLCRVMLAMLRSGECFRETPPSPAPAATFLAAAHLRPETPLA